MLSASHAGNQVNQVTLKRFLLTNEESIEVALIGVNLATVGDNGASVEEGTVEEPSTGANGKDVHPVTECQLRLNSCHLPSPSSWSQPSVGRRTPG